MASQFLRFLENIDTQRQSCVSTLQSRGFQLDNNASLGTVASQLQMLPLADNTKISDISNYVTYYDNPEEDPDVWQRPSDWPDCINMFKSYSDIIGSDGYTYYPCWMGLLDNEHSTTRFTTTRNAQTGEQVVYIDYANTSPSSSRSYRWIIKTSDEQTYELVTTSSVYPEVTHTWNSSYDINGKYRYFVVYRIVANVAQMSNTDFYNINLLELIMGTSYFGGGNQMFQSSTTFSKLQHIYKTKAVTDSGRSISYNYSAYCNLSTTNMPELRCVEEYDDTGIGYMSLNASYSYKLSKVITTNKNSIINLSSVSNAIYVKAPITMGTGERRSSLGSSESQNPNKISRIKYIENDEEEMRNYYNTNKCSGFSKLPFVQYPERLTKYITKISTDTSTDGTDFFCSFINSKYLNLSSLKEVSGRYAIDCSYAEIIDLSSLTEFPSTNILLEANNCKHLLLDSLTTVTREVKIPRDVITLNLPSLTTMSGSFTGIYQTYAYPASKLMEINAPFLTNLTNAKAFYNLYMLQKIVLPENFKYSLDLYNQSLLTHECVLDLFNKAADVTGEENYYIRLHTRVKENLTEEEKQILLNKGWEIK